MACISTNIQLANLLKQENIRGKSFLELGYVRDDGVLDFKEILCEDDVAFYRTNVKSDENIDFIWDLHKPIPGDIPVNKFDFVLCSSVMEHVAKPWDAARNIENILKPNGKLFWTTPWVQRIHGYPNDYWRYTPNGVKELFHTMKWTWEGYEVIFNGLRNSVLFDWTNDLKDPAFEFHGEGLRNLGKIAQIARHAVGLKMGTVRVASDGQVTTHDLSRHDPAKIDDTLYSYIIFQSKTVISLPMGMIFMVGQKL